MKTSYLKQTIKEEIQKILSEERDPQQIALIRGALNQIKEAGDVALNSMINNLSADEAQQLNLLVAKGIGKEFPRISSWESLSLKFRLFFVFFTHTFIFIALFTTRWI